MDNRIEIRLTPEQRRLIEQAAKRSGMDADRWALSVLLDAADDELSDFPHTIRLNAEDWETLTKALDEPMPEQMIELMARKPDWK
ncbi:DUF1778 domain-containing protein [Bifidobacterium callitrichidarum]|uniref:DUF1778 domain-containing protein n=1 Tax=Bifidobacterium callitrichidarum TaxID=2052941 RepID=A0A2U2NCF1_9BIFI|nr:DUF1778 domain-containing protein [Bifidobacterium callitrichidarum]PWG66679.1 DUF1778 domain-containing protein [Bifidobacterium callitrichidarum]